MPAPLPITKAYLQPIRWSSSGEPEPIGGDADRLFVQFNPTTLKVNYANQKAGDGQPGSAPIQFVGKGTTKLTVELLFDVTVPLPDGSEKEDVRELTQRVAKYMEPTPGQKAGQYVPPGIRFGWDTFQFEGVVDSMDETIDFFSNAGKPLRATVSLQISKQEIKIPASEGSPGTQEQHQVEEDETFQSAAAAAGLGDDWQDAAAANGIENPRMLEAGALVDLSAGFSAGISGGFSAGISGGFSAGISGGFSAGVSGGFSAGVSGGLSIGTANTLSLGVASGLGYGASSRTGASMGYGSTAGFGGSAGASAVAGFGGSASAGASAGFGGSASAGASAGFGGSASAGASTRIR